MFFLIFISFMIYSQIQENVIISSNTLNVNEIYSPKNKRNPMIKSNVYSSVTKKYSVDISTSADSFYSLDSFSLSGIINYKNEREALLKNSITGEIFILKDKKNLKSLNNSKKIINNIRGEINGRTVILYDTQKKETKEFYIE